MGAPPEAYSGGTRAAFDLTGRVAVITGGAGMLGVKHGEAIAELGGIPVLVDLNEDVARQKAQALATQFNTRALGMSCDITSPEAVRALDRRLKDEFGGVDILINNAAVNPKVESGISAKDFSRLENFPLETWNRDVAVGLTGPFLCSQVFGAGMAAKGKGVIVNIASFYGLIAPNQKLYRIEGLPDDQQPMKPISYTVVKAGLIGMTSYLATYWPGKVRVNALAPGGIYNGQPEEFLARFRGVAPMARMGGQDEFKGALAFLASDASSYMTGQTVAVDGGATCW